MAEAIALEDRANPYDEVRTLDDLEDIFNDSSSSYNTIELDRFRLTQSEKSNLKEISDNLKIQMTNELTNNLKDLIQTKNPNIDKDILAIKLSDIRKRLVSKNGELYLRDPNSKRASKVSFGTKNKHEWKAIQLTYNKGKNLYVLDRLVKNGLEKEDALYELLTDSKPSSNKTKETSLIDREIESTETLRKSVAFAYDDMTITPAPSRTAQVTSTPRSVIEEIPRQLEQSKELENVLTDEDRQTIVKYLDFVKQNYNKKIQLLNDIEFNKKAIEDAEKKLATETRK
jgi:hypothetical protein